MAKRSTVYRKLPGQRSSLMGRTSLWQGADHLLLVKTAFMNENYKRFYYKDIQALIVCRNGRQHIWTVFWGSMTLFFFIISGSAPLTFNFPTTVAGVCTLCLLVNLFKGACCDVYIQTAVQLEKLSHLVRVRKADKTVGYIKSLVEKVQGGFVYPSESTVVEKDANTVIEEHSGGNLRTESKAVIENFPTSSFSPYLHYGLFVALLMNGLAGIAQWQFKNVGLAAMDLILLSAILVLIIMAVARWHRQIKGTLLSLLTWLTMIWGGLHVIASYILFIATTISHPESAQNQTEFYKLFIEMHLEDHIAITTATIGFAAAALALAAFGLTATVDQQRRLAVVDTNSPLPSQH